MFGLDGADLLTPIPLSYAAFIQEVAWLYCILLPFQIYNLFGWVTIPATVVSPARHSKLREWICR